MSNAVLAAKVEEIKAEEIIAENPKSSTDTVSETEQPKSRAFTLAPTDEELLVTYFGAKFKDELLQFHQKILAKPTAKPSVFGSIDAPEITDKATRGRMHGDVRRIFASKLETEVRHMNPF